MACKFSKNDHDNNIKKIIKENPTTRSTSKENVSFEQHTDEKWHP